MIRTNNIDTLSVLSTDDLEIAIRRSNKRMPPRPYGVLQSFYHQELMKVRVLSTILTDAPLFSLYIIRRMHYVEYLVAAVAKANIDPLPILDLTDCVQELRRRGIPLPERGPWDTDEIYRGMCQKVRTILVISYPIVVVFLIAVAVVVDTDQQTRKEKNVINE